MSEEQEMLAHIADLAASVLSGKEPRSEREQRLEAALRAIHQIIEEVFAEEADLEIEQDWQHCREVLEQCTPMQRLILSMIAQGVSSADIQRRLTIKSATVSSHKTSLYHYCKVAWKLDQQLSTDFLRFKFGPFFRVNP